MKTNAPAQGNAERIDGERSNGRESGAGTSSVNGASCSIRRSSVVPRTFQGHGRRRPVAFDRPSRLTNAPTRPYLTAGQTLRRRASPSTLTPLDKRLRFRGIWANYRSIQCRQTRSTTTYRLLFGPSRLKTPDIFDLIRHLRRTWRKVGRPGKMEGKRLLWSVQQANEVFASFP